MTTTLFSFGNWNYYPTLDRLKESAEGKVDNVIIFKESDIDTDFYIKHQQHFKDKRGFGYWIWKSYFINKMLDKASDDDVFIYVDAGNLLIRDIKVLFNLCIKDEKGIILFNNRDGTDDGSIWKNAQWTKSDCFNLLGLNTPEYINGDQVNASYIVFRKTDFSVKFFKQFAELCSNYNIMSDAPNITNNINTAFRDHRHDQSILSLLSIRYKITIHRDPSQWGSKAIAATDPYGQLFEHHRRRYYIG
jgi:hypothetical protein